MDFLVKAVVFLGAATFVVPLFRKLGLGAVLGYVAAGVLIGPWGFALVADVENILHFAEIGVVMLLFVIGLELQPSRLRVLRRTVFGLGTAQVLITTAALTGIALACRLAPMTAVIVGFGLSLSSTAFVLQLLAERKALTAAHGRASFGVLLFQDLAVIPAIAVLPLLASKNGLVMDRGLLLEMSEVALVLAIFVFGGRYLLRPLLRIVALAQIHEIFTAAALLIVLGAGLLMETAGISMGLGAFLAGVLVADSGYRHQLEADIEPFKGLLLGLFFIAVGMSANLGLLVSAPGLVLGIVAALLAVKALILFALALVSGLPRGNATAFAVVLSQGGEFAFVLFTAAQAGGLMSREIAEHLILAVTLSMASTPLLYAWHEVRLARARAGVSERPFDQVEDTEHRVVIAGFGRFGQIIARILASMQIPFTALDASPVQVDFVRQFGNKIYYGDARRLDLLRAARIDKARVFVLAVDDVESSVQIAETVKSHFPHLKLYARARNRQHEMHLKSLGVDAIIRETLLSSLYLAEQVLIGLGLSAADARRAAEIFRRHDQETLERQLAIRDDREALIESSKDSARQLKALFEADAQARRSDQESAAGRDPLANRMRD
jgi:glutathione-regulated potassium-efflux system ancillary protein KefC/glutathione-regulated potassium-efflux system protein KefB